MDRFWTYVDIVGGDACWTWQKSKDKNGYGRFWDGAHELMAHRFSYIVANGDFNRSLVVCHKCDNPSCVRPSHLFVGTHSDNMQDMHVKGRGRDQKGSKHNMAKLSEEEVRQIKARLALGETGVSLAREFGVNDNQISRIKNGKRWKHVQ